MTNSTKAQGRKLFETHYSLVEELIRFVSRRNRLAERTNVRTSRRTPC